MAASVVASLALSLCPSVAISSVASRVDPPGEPRGDEGRRREPDWEIRLVEMGFCPMMDCDPPPLPPVPRVYSGRLSGVTVSGSLSRQTIRRHVRLQGNRIRGCYERQLLADRTLAGRVVSRFVIGPEGRVEHAVVASSTLGSRAVEACVLDTLAGIVFPTAEGGGTTIVSYPFLFRPSDAAPP